MGTTKAAKMSGDCVGVVNPSVGTDTQSLFARNVKNRWRTIGTSGTRKVNVRAGEKVSNQKQTKKNGSGIYMIGFTVLALIYAPGLAIANSLLGGDSSAGWGGCWLSAGILIVSLMLGKVKFLG